MNFERIHLLVIFTLSMYAVDHLFPWFYRHISTPLPRGNYRVLTSYPVRRIGDASGLAISGAMEVCVVQARVNVIFGVPTSPCVFFSTREAPRSSLVVSHASLIYCSPSLSNSLSFSLSLSVCLSVCP